MRKQGKEMYGDDAYGPDGNLIDTNRAFTINTQFVSTADYSDLWMLRTTLTQDSNEIVMEADCTDYLNEFDADIEGNMTFVFATWDNREYEFADFECDGLCPQPASTCDDASVAFSNVKFTQDGSNWDPVEDESDDEDEEEDEDDEDEDEEESDEDEDPVSFESFTGNLDFYGEWQFYVKGIQGSHLETDYDTITMHENNRAFVLDYPFDESVFWAYNNKYLGGSVTFDVDISSVGCGCAAGVYLTKLDDDQCSWNSYEAGTKP